MRHDASRRALSTGAAFLQPYALRPTLITAVSFRDIVSRRETVTDSAGLMPD